MSTTFQLLIAVLAVMAGVVGIMEVVKRVEQR